MKPHVQAWFTIPFDSAQVSNARELRAITNKTFDDMTSEEFDAITAQLKGEFIVEVRKAGAQVSLPKEAPVYMRVPFTTVIGEQIQTWIRDQAAFDPAAIHVRDGDVLVEVRAECCGKCSTGNACHCPWPPQ